MWRKACVILAAAAAAAWAQGGMSRAEAFRRAKELAEFGKALFFDQALSASGKLACATCHDPKSAYGPPDTMTVAPGGIRAIPSLRYLQSSPAFTEHYYVNEGPDGEADAGPTGGVTWDGRVDRAREQARLPLLASFEMANANEAAVVERVRRRPYGVPVRGLRARDAFARICEALEAWQQTADEFFPYTSKYDAALAGRVALTAAEKRGLALFLDPKKGDCARCHPALKGPRGESPQFTDYGYAALGVPRNAKIAANGDARWFDLGLCGPERKDLRAKAEYCGRFLTPTLRNVATRHSFFHNGVVGTLRDAVNFYATRDAEPRRWYAGAKFDDLPPRYRGNVETGAPFAARARLDSREVDDIVTFLGTLTDGWR